MLLILFALWIAFNGKFTVEIAVIGVLVSLVIYGFICKFMDYSPKKDMKVFKNLFRGIAYAAILVWEIVKANINVMNLILSGKYEVEPAIVRFKTKLKSDVSRVALANSITLTPGTITVTLEKDEYVVHCLDKDFAEGMDDSVFVHLLEKIEK